MATVQLKDVMAATRIKGETMKEWSHEWNRLSDAEKETLREYVSQATDSE